MTGGVLVIRDPVPGELPLLTQTYVRESRKALPAAEAMAEPVRAALAERFLAACVEDGHVQVLGSRDGMVCAGYALGVRETGPNGADRAIVHWVYLRSDYRGHGFARRLLQRMTSGCSDVRVTHSCSKRQSRRIRAEGWRWAPRVPWLWLLARRSNAA